MTAVPLVLALALAAMSVADAAPRRRPAASGRDAARSFPPLPPPRPADLGGAPSVAPAPAVSPAPAPASVPAPPPREVCAERLAAQGIVVQPGEVEAPTAACAIDEPVHLKSVGGVTIAGEPLVACTMAETFGLFVRDVASPLTKGATGSALKSIAVGGGFECRPRNGVAGAKPSSHGQGLAIDVMSFTLADGRRIAVESSTDAPLLRGLRMAACGAFTTVLGPGADAAHATHLHLDLEKHGSSDRYRICQ